MTGGGDNPRKRKAAVPEVPAHMLPTANKRRDTKKVIAERLAAEAKATADRLAALQALRDAEIASRPPSPPGRPGDRNFYARFLQVGQGDCIIMTTPRGQRILVDCGSTATETDNQSLYIQRIYDQLNDRKFLGPSMLNGRAVARRIDILILTHADEDHYNKLSAVLGSRGITVGKVYHSADRGHYGTANQWFYDNAVDVAQVRAVVLNKEKAPASRPESGAGAITMNGVAVTAAASATSVDCLDGQSGIRIVAETDPFCAVTILAAGVRTDYVGDDSDGGGKNRGSVVTLVEVFDGTNRKKLLLCGDATRSTEAYLMTRGRYATQNMARLAAVDVMHVGHHGSITTSSSVEFVTLVNPKDRALVCAGKVGISSHHLPSWPTIKRYVSRFTTRLRTVPAHVISAWDTDYSLHKPKVDTVTSPIYTTGSHGDQSLDWLRP